MHQLHLATESRTGTNGSSSPVAAMTSQTGEGLRAGVMTDNEQLDETVPDRRTAERRQQDRREEDRGTPANPWWHDPRFYIALVALIVTLSGSAWAIARNIAITGSEVSRMRSELTTISTTIAAISNDSTRKDEKIRTLEEEVRSLKIGLEDVKKSQNDYNYNLSTRVARLEK
jgi:hypothetical protein